MRLSVLVIACAAFMFPATSHALVMIDFDGGGPTPGGGGPTPGGGDGGGETTIFPYITMSATPSSIEPGYASKLSWSGQYLSSCSINQGIGSVSATSGYLNVYPTATATYTISCATTIGTTVSDSTTVNVYVPPPPVSVSMSANPTSVPSGSSAQLSWSSSNATSCFINQGIGSVVTSGTRPVVPTATASYTLTCSGAGGSASATATVSVSEPVSGSTVSGYVWTAVGAEDGPICTDSVISVTGGDDHRRPPTCSASTRGTRYTQYEITQGSCMVYWDATGAYGYGYDITSQEYVCEAIPDLTASAVTPGTAVAGTATTFSATVANSGDKTAGTSVTRFQRATDGSGTGATTIADVTTSSVGGGSTRGVSTSYTWPSAGTYYARVCADIGGAVSELNESNNCGVWTKVTVSAPPIPPTASLSASPLAITNGNASTLTWGSTNATSCTGTNFSTGGATSGSVSVSPAADTTYTVTCTGVAGTASAAKTVTVRPAPPTGLTSSCNAAGTSVTLSWNPSSGATNYYVRMTGVSTDGYTGTSITYPVTPNQYYDWWVHSNMGPANYDSNHYSDAAYGGFTCSAIADLTASAVSVPTAIAGHAAALNATASNIGNGASGSFPILFQVSETGALVQSGYLAGLPAGNSGSGSGSYVFSSAGTYQVRACANYNTSWTAITTESNYGNNCGPWTSVQVSPDLKPAVSCTVSSSNVLPGGSVTYSAHPVDGASAPYTWTASDGTNVGTGATATRSFAAGGTYAMNVRASNTTVSYCPNVSVVATWCTNSSTDLSITATPNRVRAGQSVALAWNATGVNGQDATCTVTGPGVSWSSAVSAVPVCSASGTANPTITTQSTYTLTCGGSSKSVTVNVIPNFQEF